MYYTLTCMGVFPHTLHLIVGLYESQEMAASLLSRETGKVSVSNGVRQGCLLLPYLFNFYGKQIMHNVNPEEEMAGIRIVNRGINNLRYADDATGCHKSSGSAVTC